MAAAEFVMQEDALAKPEWAEHLDGLEALRSCIRGTDFGTVEQALASLTVFTSPEIVAAVEGDRLFPIVRDNPKRRTIGSYEGESVYFDDNQAPHFSFQYANKLPKPRGAQLNHIIAARQAPKLHTNLRNLCLTPRWLSFLTDDRRADFWKLLEYRSYLLYDVPLGEAVPPKPSGYDDLKWADPLDAHEDLQGRLRQALRKNPQSTPAKAAREIGWFFSNWEPDPELQLR